MFYYTFTNTELKVELTIFAFSLFTLSPELLSAPDTMPLLGQPLLLAHHQVSTVSTPN